MAMQNKDAKWKYKVKMQRGDIKWKCIGVMQSRICKAEIQDGMQNGNTKVATWKYKVEILSRNAKCEWKVQRKVCNVQMQRADATRMAKHTTNCDTKCKCKVHGKVQYNL